MQIVIDISEKEYKRCQNLTILDYFYAVDFLKRVGGVIDRGVVLPEGRGRLIDGDALKQRLEERHKFFVSAYGCFSLMTQNDKARMDELVQCIADVVNSPTVLEGRGKEEWE